MTLTTARALTDIIGTLIMLLAMRGILTGDDVLILAAIAERHAKQQ